MSQKYRNRVKQTAQRDRRKSGLQVKNRVLAVAVLLLAMTLILSAFLNPSVFLKISAKSPEDLLGELRTPAFRQDVARCKAKFTDAVSKPKFCVHSPLLAHSRYGLNVLGPQDVDIDPPIYYLEQGCDPAEPGMHYVDLIAAPQYKGWGLPNACTILINVEPPQVYERFYGLSLYDYFAAFAPMADLSLSFADISVLHLPRAYHYVPHITQVRKEEQMIYDKTKLVSIIASTKNTCVGHQLRHQVIQALGAKYHVDAIGRGYAPFENKVDGFKDYMYTIAIENSIEKFYFTDKLVDTFLTGTIPIYWYVAFDRFLASDHLFTNILPLCRGSPLALQLFDTRGMYFFSTIDELEAILRRLSPQDYKSKLPYIKENFKRAKEYQYQEQFFKKYIDD